MDASFSLASSLRFATVFALLAALIPGVPRMTDAQTLSTFDELWDYGDPAGTEAAFRELLPEAEAGDDRDLHAQLLTQIARCQGLRGDFDSAHATLDGVAEMLPEGPSVARARYELERGRALRSGGDPAASRPLFDAAWETANAVGSDGFAVDAAHMIAIVAEPEEAMQWNERALALAEGSDDPRAQRWVGSLLNNMGWTHHDAGRFEAAHELFERALAFRLTQGNPNATRIARWSVARALRSLGRLDEALTIQSMLAAEHEAAGSSDGYVQEELGELLLAMGRADESRGHFARAAELLGADDWFVANEAERLARLRTLAEEPATEP